MKDFLNVLKEQLDRVLAKIEEDDSINHVQDYNGLLNALFVLKNTIMQQEQIEKSRQEAEEQRAPQEEDFEEVKSCEE